MLNVLTCLEWLYVVQEQAHGCFWNFLGDTSNNYLMADL